MARARQTQTGLAVALPGLSVREAIASRSFWLLGVGIILVAMVVNGVVVHVVSLLSDRGWPVDAAARIMIWAGLASLVGRLIAGYLLDRFFAPYVALFSFLVALAGLYLLASDTSPVLGMIGVGMTTGAEIDIIAYMTSRYFGLRQFGQLYGYLFGLFLVGTGAGPMLMGAVHTRLQSYDAAFLAFGGWHSWVPDVIFVLYSIQSRKRAR
jgi:MFS family permease